MRTLAKDFVHKLAEEGGPGTQSEPSVKSQNSHPHQPRQRQSHHLPLQPHSSINHFDYDDDVLHVPVLR